ncbi:MAG: CNP1-like family protein [Thiotrichaceae bacterium]|nr:CNP1-like family protein [Thiotrichaceae bacterium]
MLRGFMLGIALCSVNAAATELGEPEDLSGGYAEASRPKVSSTPIELALTLPKFPKKEDLQSFSVDEVENTQFELDTQNLSIGKDGIVRYSVVITAATGLPNVFYEGIRCATAEYKTYAFGSSHTSFQKQLHADWAKISRNSRGTARYRFALLDYYLCNRNEGAPYSKDTIIYNLSHAPAEKFAD